MNKYAAIAISILIIGAFGYLFLDILTYLFTSIILSTILRPLTNRLDDFRAFGVSMHRSIAVLLSFMVLGLITAAFFSMLIPLINDQILLIRDINFNKLSDSALLFIRKLEEFLIQNNIYNEEKGFIIQWLNEMKLNLLKGINFSTFLEEAFSFTGSLFLFFLAVSFITFYLLYEKFLLRKIFFDVIPNKYFEMTVSAFYKIEQLLTKYLVGVTIQITCLFCVAAIGLSILNIKFALTIALIAALANLVPYLGPIVGASVGIIIGLSSSYQMGGDINYFFLALKIAIVFGVVQIIDNTIFQPQIFSKSVKAHPLEIFVIIFAGGSLAGIIGMILAVPFYTIVRVSFTEAIKGFSRYKIFSI